MTDTLAGYEAGLEEGRREKALELARWCDERRAVRYEAADRLERDGKGPAAVLSRQFGDVYFECAAECRRRAEQ